MDSLEYGVVNDSPAYGVIGESNAHAPARTNHWFSSASIIIGAMAGAGVLGISEAVQASGWFGIILLFIVAVFNVYTGLLLGATMREMPPEKIKDYASIGEYAFGKVGVYISHFSQYVTLTGVSIIFLVLIGLLMNTVVPQAPRGFFTLVIGLSMIPVIIIFRSLSEARWASYFAVLTTLFVCAVSIGVALQFYFSDDFDKERAEDPKIGAHKIINWDTMAVGFSVFTFAFGATALFPNIYVHMKNQDHWPLSVCSSYSFALATMYFPVGIVGYYVLGDALEGTGNILAALSSYVSGGDVWVRVGAGVIVLHLLFALPLVLTPVLQKAEEIVNKRQRFLLTVVIRSVLVGLFTVIGLFLPYFLPLMGVVTNLSVTISCYLLPPLFYIKIVRPGTPVLMVVLCVITFLFGLFGSGVGLYESMKQLIDAVKENPNPFEGLFTFDT